MIGSLFPRLARRPAAPAHGLEVSSPAAVSPGAGLVVIHATVSATPGGLFELGVSLGGARAEGARRLTLSPAPQDTWIALHSQMLDNGPCAVTVELRDEAGQVLLARPLALHIDNPEPLRSQVAASLRSRATPLVLGGPCDAALYDYDDSALAPWFDRGAEDAEAHVRRSLQDGLISAAEADELRGFVRDGYAILSAAVEPALLARLNAGLDRAVAAGHEGYRWGESQRLHGLHEQDPAFRELAHHPVILRRLRQIFDAPPAPCQSLVFPFGSEDPPHQDTLYLTPFPAGYMCGVWIALEDIEAGSGELQIYPGSHRLPRVHAASIGLPKIADGDYGPVDRLATPAWQRLLDDGGLTPKPFLPKAGDVLIWHENLMHGGSPRVRRQRSRRSVVCHYFARGAVSFYDTLGVPAGEIAAPSE